MVRPLLGFRRAELRDYLRARGQTWREDSSNQDEAFLRNRLRLRVLPAIVNEFGPSAIERLAELAEIARAEEEWAVSTLGLSEAVPVLDVEALLDLHLAAARRLVRAWVQANAPEVSLSFRLIEEILDLARGPAGKRVELPGRAPAAKRSGRVGARVWAVRRGRKQLVLEAGVCGKAGDYAYELPVPGKVAIAELRAQIEACVVDAENVPETERDGLLDPERVAGKVVIRNWRAGDRFWPAHTSAEKKVKELLAGRHATGVEKKLWPVAVAAGELVWMRGFAAPEKWRARGGKGIWIREIAGLM